MRIVWIGHHMEGISALGALQESGADLVGVITLDEEIRTKRSGAVDYAQSLGTLCCPVHFVKDINSPESVNLIRSLNPDVIFVIGWNQILSPDVLRLARIGTVGTHASFLPHNRGSAPVNWALIKGENTTGNTLMWLSEEVDEGEIIDQIELPVSIYDTCQTVYDKVAQTNRDMILALLKRLNNGERPGRPQPVSSEPLLPRRRPSDGNIEWSAHALSVYNFIRALTRPYPGAFSYLDGRKYFIWQAALLPDMGVCTCFPGTVVGPVYSPVESACGQMVACGKGAVVILEVEDEDGSVLKGRTLSNQDWQGVRWHYE